MAALEWRAMLKYLWVDMNSFFASVEQQESPSLRGRAVGVVPMRTDTTCVIAASYEAKAKGVKTGTRVLDARRLCPGIILVEARPDLYVQYHHRIVDAVESCLHVERVCSIDEMYGRLMSNERDPEVAAVIAHQVKAAIGRLVGDSMRCSIGLAPNVWLGKVAADMNKPDGLTMILPQQMPEAIHVLKLTDLPGIGHAMERRLHERGIMHVHQLCQMSEAELAAVWGSKVHGAIWFQQLRGVDLPHRSTHRCNVGHSHVLPPDLRTHDGARAVLVRMIHKAAARMRRLHYWANEMGVTVDCLGGPQWHRRAILNQTRDTLTMVRALDALWVAPLPGKPLKVSVDLTSLTADQSATMPLFTGQERLDRLAMTMDKIDAKHGRHTIYFGGMFGMKNAAPTRISFTCIPGMDEF